MLIACAVSSDANQYDAKQW